jgi:hypothetical protein
MLNDRLINFAQGGFVDSGCRKCRRQRPAHRLIGRALMI